MNDTKQTEFDKKFEELRDKAKGLGIDIPEPMTDEEFDELFFSDKPLVI